MESWLDRIVARGAFADREEARRAATATLEVLASGLSPDEARALADVLPSGLSELVVPRAFGLTLSASGLYAGVARRLGIRVGIAAEMAQTVCGVVAAMLPSEQRLRLARHAPKLATLFDVPPPSRAPEDAEVLRRAPPTRSTLAEGRPGSRHPVCEAGPPEGQLESIARSDDPHAATKLSSSAGTTQERESETLADADPGARRRMSKA